MSQPRILAIRGGAIGDFILTLPALRLLRESFAYCHLEILGYPHIAALALHGGPAPGSTYADAVRSIEYGPLAGFFARGGDLDAELCEYFAGFQQVVSWLFDPDGIFENNVKRAGVKHYLSAYTKITDDAHASVQLARGLEGLALYLEDPVARLVPAVAAPRRFDAALHPGSGSARKNWPIEHWCALAGQLVESGGRLLVLGGEADEEALDALAPLASEVARGRPLPEVAALLTGCGCYFGHDTGLSHLAAAVGTPSTTLLFGPTDPAIWAPAGPHVRVLRPPSGRLEDLTVEAVLTNTV